MDELVAEFERKYRAFNTPRTIGIELEYPVVQSDGTPIDVASLRQLWQHLINAEGWSPRLDAATKDVVGVLSPPIPNVTGYTQDVITMDFGFPTLEISLTPSTNLEEAEAHLLSVLKLVTAKLADLDCHLLGCGVQPLAEPGDLYVAPLRRHQLFFSIYEKERASRNFSHDLYIHCSSAASQVHVAVPMDQVFRALNALNASAGLRIALLANSTVWRGQVSEYRAIRELFWDWCWPNRAQQVGIPQRFLDSRSYVDYLLDFRALMVKRDEQVEVLDNQRAFRSFFASLNDTIDPEREVSLKSSDITQLPSFAWNCTRLQPAYGTLEDRIGCQQPPDAQLAPAALTLGLIENLSELEKLTKRYSLDQWREIRSLACQAGLSAHYETPIKPLVSDMLTIAEQGLYQRGLNEERYLEPLKRRLQTNETAADQVAKVFQTEGIAGLIDYCDMRNAIK